MTDHQWKTGSSGLVYDTTLYDDQTPFEDGDTLTVADGAINAQGAAGTSGDLTTGTYILNPVSSAFASTDFINISLPASATMILEGSGRIDFYYTDSFTNVGLFEIGTAGTPATNTNLDALFPESGTTTTLFRNNGQMVIQNGSTVVEDLAGNDVAQGFSNASGATLTLAGKSVFNIWNSVANAYDVTSGSGLFVNNGTINITGGSIFREFNAYTGTGTLNMTGSDSLAILGGKSVNGNFTIGSGAGLIFESPANVAAGYVSGTVTFTGYNGLLEFIQESGDTRLGNLYNPSNLVISGFQKSDQIDLNGYIGNADRMGYDSNTGVLSFYEVENGTNVVRTSLTFANPTQYSIADFQIANGILTTTVTPSATCFLAEVSLATTEGRLAVEDLHARFVAGKPLPDAITVTPGGVLEAEPISWVGKGTLSAAAARHHPPVLIRKDAFGPGCPAGDIRLTEEHCIALNGGLIPLRMLVNGATILHEPVADGYAFFHIETMRHTVLLADGLPVESYLDTGNRATFSASVTALQPPDGYAQERMCLPLTVDRAQVEPLWRTVAERAQTLGRVLPPPPPVTTDPGLYLFTVPLSGKGGIVRPSHTENGLLSFVIPPGTMGVNLISRAGAPADAIGPFVDDRRHLGVLIGDVTLIQGAETRHLTDFLTTPDLLGWYAPEAGPYRWTKGCAALPFGKGHDASRPARLSLRIVTGGPYLIDADTDQSKLRA